MTKQRAQDFLGASRSMSSDSWVLGGSALLYVIVAWFVFQWRNPLSNEMAFFREFVDVVTWQTLVEYQP